MHSLFSLDRFEHCVYTRSHEAAVVELNRVLALLANRHGEFGCEFQASGLNAGLNAGLDAVLDFGAYTASNIAASNIATSVTADQAHGLKPESKLTARAANLVEQAARLRQHRFCSRLTSAVATLFADADFRPSGASLKRLLGFHEWLGLLFSAAAAAGTGNADHVARHLNPRGVADRSFCPDDRFVEKLCLLYSIESELELDLAALWAYNATLAASLALALLAPVFTGSAAAHGKREALLAWLPGKLRLIDDLDDLPSAVLHHAYMYCSYADTPLRHEIKQDINVLVRRKLGQLGLADLPHATEAMEAMEGSEATSGSSPPAVRAPAMQRPGAGRKKPLMLVVLEWFGGAHSIFRTHSRTLEAARAQFEVVAFGFGYAVDQAGRAIFDRFIELKEPDYIGECLRTVRAFAEQERPDVLYMPSVGMFVLTIFLSNLRIAPLQIAALGHPATTHSGQIDCISVEEDYIGDPACFSETLLRLPKDGQPYVYSHAMPDIVAQVPQRRDRLTVIVTASPMKLNPGFLKACAEILARAHQPVVFHFMTGARNGLPLERMREVIGYAVPGAHVHGFHSYAAYLERVNHADLFLSPFPFGNTNGIVDAFTVGLPGVCKLGREVFERIDAALFRRAGLPDWTIAEETDTYIAAAVRLIDRHDEREALRQRLIDTHAVQRFFEGRPEAFGERVLERLSKDKARCVARTAV